MSVEFVLPPPPQACKSKINNTLKERDLVRYCFIWKELKSMLHFSPFSCFRLSHEKATWPIICALEMRRLTWSSNRELDAMTHAMALLALNFEYTVHFLDSLLYVQYASACGAGCDDGCCNKALAIVCKLNF